MTRSVVFLLQTVLAALGALFLLAQLWFLPKLSRDVAFLNPEYAHLRVPILVACIGYLVCAELVLVSISRLTHLMAGNRILTFSALPWLYLAMIACGVATVLAGGGLVADLASALGPITLPLMLIFAALLPVAGFCLAVVLRSLLLRAIAAEQELAEVI